jgi:hypothetical protein
MRFIGHMGWGSGKKIKRGWEVFSSYTRFKVRDGSKIRF